MYLYMVSAQILNMGALVGGAVTIYMYSIPYGQFLGTRFSLEHLFFFFNGTLYGNDVNLRNSMGYIYNMYILLLLIIIIINYYYYYVHTLYDIGRGFVVQSVAYSMSSKGHFGNCGLYVEFRKS